MDYLTIQLIAAACLLGFFDVALIYILIGQEFKHEKQVKQSEQELSMINLISENRLKEIRRLQDDLHLCRLDLEYFKKEFE
jgi:hypothetical protein